MGNTGSYTLKATLPPSLLAFSKWGSAEVQEFFLRGHKSLSESFGLKKLEFEFLLGKDLVEFKTMRYLFSEIFDTDKNNTVDKMEVMCAIFLTSKISNEEKIHYFFELFNFNNKGYLFESEIILMLLAITRGAFKVDQKYHPPAISIMTKLAKEALTNAVVDPTQKSLRKPELVMFALRNPDVLAFLETWRGHAAQVLLQRDYTQADAIIMWRDKYFFCGHSSIAPSREWLQFGMPPSDFVRWRRRSKIGVGCIYLFNHRQDYFKTVDKKVYYVGQGVLGRGYIRQGLLADRFLLNGLAAMTCRPELLMNCFATTKQEDYGRFSVRFFEGSGWRTVYIDDRLPCDLDGNPIFCSSSDGLEAWPMLVEKALAKYLGGSYGLIAHCSGRSDASLFSLRLLTGGHVSRLFTSAFDWQSVSNDIQFGSLDGIAAVERLLEEGSCVSFGVSESRAMMSRKDGGSTGEIIPPFGRLFPLLAVEKKNNGFKFLVFRDPWGLMTSRERDYEADSMSDRGTEGGEGDGDEADFLTGHCNTFRIPVESVTRLFDSIVLSRFPDSLRDRTQMLGLPQWQTKILNQITKGPEKPARFLLTVSKKENATKGKSIAERKKKYIPPNVHEVLVSADGNQALGAAVPSDIAQYKVKDSFDFSRNKPKFGKTLKQTEAEAANEEAKKDEVTLVPNDDELVDLALTVSSSCDWIVSGSDICNPKLRVRIVPSPSTLTAMITRDNLLRRHKKQLSDLARSRKALLAARLALEKTSVGVAPEEKSSDLKPEIKTVDEKIDQVNDEKKETYDDLVKNAVDNAQSEEKKLRSFDVELTSETSWLSHSVKLLPGEYSVLVDISFDIPYSAAFQLSLPKDRMETPWFENYRPPADVPKAVFKKALNAEDRETRRDEDSTGGKSAPTVTFSMLSLSSSMKRVAEEIKRLAAADVSLEHNVWLQASSLESISIEKFVKFSSDESNAKNVEKFKDVKIGNFSDLIDMKVQPQKGPFMSESQLEVSSRELTNLLTQLRSEAVLVGAELVNIIAKYKDIRKNQLKDGAAKKPPNS